MSWFGNLRFLALARRGVRALEKLADAHSDIARVYTDSWRRQNARGAPSPTEFGVMDQKATERVWAERLESELRDR